MILRNLKPIRNLYNETRFQIKQIDLRFSIVVFLKTSITVKNTLYHTFH